jgi:hypothetical protein
VIRPTKVTANAGGSIYLDLEGRLRHTSPTSAMVVNVDSLQAGTDVDVLLQGSVLETKVKGSPGALVVVAPTLKPAQPPYSYVNFFPKSDPNLSFGLDPGVYADTTQATPIPSTYNFRSLDTQGNRTLPGIVAGRNILINAAHPATTDPSRLIDVVGITNLTGTGFIDTVTSGNITLTEVLGGLMRVRTIHSTVGDIRLTVPDAPTAGQDIVIIDGGQITAPGGISAPTSAAPTIAPMVSPTGGNTPAVNPGGGPPTTVSGYLAAGTYYVVYTYMYADGTESTSSPASAPFIVAAGNIPQVTMPLLPVGAVGYNLYLSNPSATPGSATRYAAGIKTTTFNLLNAVAPGGATPPATTPAANNPTVTPTVTATGGGTSGGTLAPGTYFVFYTFTSASGTETFASPSSATFTVTAGNIPRVVLPPLPGGFTGINVYVSDATAQSGSGVLYAAGIKSGTFDLASEPPNGGAGRPVANDPNVPPLPLVDPRGGNKTAVPGACCGTDVSMTGMPAGRLAPGTYYVVYTFTYPTGAETFASNPSATFQVKGGGGASADLPQVTLPPLPPGATGINLYLSDNAADPGTATRYATGITNTIFNLSYAAPAGGASPPSYSLAPVTPTVNPVGGNVYGGQMFPGTYYVLYTFAYPNGTETAPSPQSLPFMVVAGNVPQVYLPPLPTGATGINLYLSDPAANANSATLYASGITTPTYNLVRNALAGLVIPPALNNPAAVPSVNATGAGAAGGNLAPGTYFVFYTLTNVYGAESFASPPSAPFTVTAGNIPLVTLPPLPAGVLPGGQTGYSLYISDNSAHPGSALRYASGITSTTFAMTAALPTDGVRPPVNNSATIAPLAQPMGGGVTGGQLAAGTYYVTYTYTDANGNESFASPPSAFFTVAAGEIPLITLPPLPTGMTGYDLYISDASADPGSTTRYATGITSPTYLLQGSVPLAGVVAPVITGATLAASVNPTGGGATGGRLAPGTYFLSYTYTYPNGAETFASPNSTTFTVTSGNIPRVTFPPLAAGATGYNLYLSDASAHTGSVMTYAVGIKVGVFDLAAPAPTGGIAPPTPHIATVAPTVDPVGGGPTTGKLLPGSYYVFYTFSYPGNLETSPSPGSSAFTVALGNVPLVTLPNLPAGATGINLYLADATAPAGSAVRYASGITQTTYALRVNAPTGGLDRPIDPIATLKPLVDPTGGGTAGGNLAPGTYDILYTFNYPFGVESAPSPVSLRFTVTAGNIPQLYMPLLPVGVVPVGALSYNLYLSDTSADPGTETRYATGLTATIYNLFVAAPTGGVRPPMTHVAALPAVVNPTGGGALGGGLAPGTYFVSYTITYPDGAETFASPNSAPFTVAAGNIPQISLPALPAGATGYNLYLSDSAAHAGSATRIASAVATTTYFLRSGAPPVGIAHPASAIASTAAQVLPRGGNVAGAVGNLAPGTYFLDYTFTFASGAESFVSPDSAPFTVAAGDIPQVILPTLPNGATGYNLYLSDPSAGPGSALRYASGVSSSIVNLQDAAPDGGLSHPIANSAATPATVDPAGGGGSGGHLFPGTYYVLYTFIYPNGSESFPGPASAAFTVAAGDIPRVTLPALPASASGYSLYLSDPLGNPGSATLYQSGITTPTADLAKSAIAGAIVPPPTMAFGTSSIPPVPVVDATGGGTSGGKLAPGQYFVFYTPTDAAGSETYLTASSATFTVTAGNIPVVTLPPVPDGDSGFDLYLSDAAATPGSGTLYAAGITATRYLLEKAARTGGAVTLLIGDNVPVPATTLIAARHDATIRGDFGSNVDPGVATTFDVDSAIVAPDVVLSGGRDNDTFNIQATSAGSKVTIDTGVGTNTINTGSIQPKFNGVMDYLQGAEYIRGSGNDTLNVDDHASLGPKTGFLTAAPTPVFQNAPAGALTGLSMGPLGVSYSGLSNLTGFLGPGGSTIPTSPVVGNVFSIDVPAALNLPATTTIFGGASNNDSVRGTWDTNFNTLLNLYEFEKGTVAVGNDFTGTMNDLRPGSLQSVTIGHAMTPGSVLSAGSVDAMSVGPNHLVVGDNLAGQLSVLGKLGAVTIAGGTPGTITAGSIGTLGVAGGYGPVVAQIRENGIQRRIDAALPTDPYPVPVATALPTPSGSTYVNFAYFYEGLAANLNDPQLTARITNGVGAGPDQYDLSLITDNDLAKFNLARLDTGQVAGPRNIVVEGDLLQSVTPAAQAFLGGAATLPGIRLPLDNLAGVGIRDFAPRGSIQAKSIQGISFGSTTRSTLFHTIYGSNELPFDAANLLVTGTAIVQASDTFRVPFADVTNQQVGFFIDTDLYSARFDVSNVIFTVQANNGQQQNAARGASTALVTVAKQASPFSPLSPRATPPDLPPVAAMPSIIQSIDLHGDGASLTSKLWVSKSITSTGPLGDVYIQSLLGTTDVTAPNIFGNIRTYGPIAGTIQTTGLAVDPITGTTYTTGGDLGHAYIVLRADGSPVVTSTIVETFTSGRPVLGTGITGDIFVRGNLLSLVQTTGGLNGRIVTQGDIGGTSMLLSRTSPTRVGGVASDSADTGQIVALGSIIGDVQLGGGLSGAGRVASRGSILGNLAIIGALTPGTAVISGGSIGSPTLGTGLTIGSNQGIIAAKGSIRLPLGLPTSPGFFAADLGAVAPPDNIDAQVIDAIFSDPAGVRLASFDSIILGDDVNLKGMLGALARLHVARRHLAIT